MQAVQVHIGMGGGGVVLVGYNMVVGARQAW